MISWRNRDKFKEWRRKVGEEEANNVTRKATHRGTDAHTLIEEYLNNVEKLSLSSVLPLSQYLFKQAKPDLDKIDNILCQEQSLWSFELGIAGSVDCIAEHTGENGEPELAIIDFKTSTKERQDSYNESYYIQASAYAEMFEERTGIEINQICILVVTADGVCQEFVKEKKDYLPLLTDAIAEWKRKNEKVNVVDNDIIGVPV